MSNHSHLHEIELEKGKMVSVDAFGMREECDVCRERQGLPLMAEIEAQRAAAARGELVSFHGGEAPNAELKASLEEAEAEVLTLRRQLREGSPELAAERDKAVAEVGTLTRQITALEKQLAQIPALEKQLQAEREKSASLEQSLATKKKP